MDIVEQLRDQGPASMVDSKRWTQRDSDIIAHFLQVYWQIWTSRWYAADVKFTYQADKLLESSMPAFEDFVYAAVYFRQLILDKDDLIHDAVDRYYKHVDSGTRKAIVMQQVGYFEGRLKANTAPFPIGSFTLHQIFDAFLYGASLMHTVPHEKRPDRHDFLKIYDGYPRARVLYALHAGLKNLVNYIGRIAVLMHQDYTHWQRSYSLPPPEIRWHDRLFHVELDG